MTPAPWKLVSEPEDDSTIIGADGSIAAVSPNNVHHAHLMCMAINEDGMGLENLEDEVAVEIATNRRYARRRAAGLSGA